MPNNFAGSPLPCATHCLYGRIQDVLPILCQWGLAPGRSHPLIWCLSIVAGGILGQQFCCPTDHPCSDWRTVRQFLFDAMFQPMSQRTRLRVNPANGVLHPAVAFGFADWAVYKYHCAGPNLLYCCLDARHRKFLVRFQYDTRFLETTIVPILYETSAEPMCSIHVPVVKQLICPTTPEPVLHNHQIWKVVSASLVLPNAIVKPHVIH